MSPQVRRLGAFQPMSVDQSQASQDETVCLPRLLETRSSLPGLSTEEGESYRRRCSSLTSDKLANELSVRKEGPGHRIVSPRLAEKQQHPLNVGNEWFNELSSKDELPEGQLGRNDSHREENGSPLGWNSVDDEDYDGDEDADNTFVTKVQEKKIHSMEEIKHTRYLRMKSPNHWLPKMGKVPQNLLSSSIIIGHTKLTYESVSTGEEEEEEDDDVFEDDENGFAENEDAESRDAVEHLKNSKTQEDGCETENSVRDNSRELELRENSVQQ